MNILLTAINAKYIHSNLAVYSLKAYADEFGGNISIAEYTINQRTDEILMDLYKRKPDILCFSCYLWNLTWVEELIRDINKILPDTMIWLGGPEVTYDAQDVLKRYPEVDIVMTGEGEATFFELVSCMHNTGYDEKVLKEIKGIVFRSRSGEIFDCGRRETVDLNTVPFVYEHLGQFEHKIIYYETSRGCPFSCSYCLSSIDKTLRFRNIELVKKELGHFLDHNVPQVKFVDRTFNCSHKHAMEIWTYIKEHDNGITNFHFEVAADLFCPEEIELIKTMRPGQIQLEIGVQSTNEKTIAEIRRVMDFGQVSVVVKEIGRSGNVHQHLDLIAGLPYEDYQSFRRSFNHVYALRPEQLQLGFLKVLKGSYMEQQKDHYRLVYKSSPNYEVLSTRWLSYQDILRLKHVEEMVEVYYNSGQFTATIPFLEQAFDDPFQLYEELSIYYEENDLHTLNHSRVRRYEILLEFASARDNRRGEQYRELLTYDLYLRENLKSRPPFAGEAVTGDERIRAFYNTETLCRRYLQGYESYDKHQLRKMTHIERFSYTVDRDGKQQECWLLFDYRNRKPISGQATVFRLGFD